jgi:serine protease AprX
MNKKIVSLVIISCFSFLSINTNAQVKYWVHFKDKAGTPYTISNPSAFLTQQSISRRTTYNIPLDITDLPVTPSYITQVENVPNITVLYASKWLNGLVVSAPDRTLAITALSTINSFTFVLDTVHVKRYHLNIQDPVNPNPVSDLSFSNRPNNTSGTYNYGGSYWQNEQVNVICLHEQGYRGQGMTIAILDAGFINVNTFDVYDSLRNRGGILGTRDFVSGGTNVYQSITHGSAVLSCIAGNKPGRILGSAPLANFWLLRTEDAATETISEEYNWIRGAEFADSVGADILTTSLGYTEFDDPSENHTYATLNGRTAPMSIAANMAARKGLFVLNAAGNEGANAWHYISVPGDADSICTVGAIDSTGIVAQFSSVGPTYDHRIKPDLVSRGVGAWVADGTSDGFPGNGTSFATPILAGAVACFWQAHRSYNNIKVLDTLKKGATNACSPDNSQGWGIPKMCPVTIIHSSAFLNNKTSHSGIKVKFIAISANARTDSTTTNADGTYSISLNDGDYKIVFSKNGYTNDYYSNVQITVKPCLALNTVTLQVIIYLLEAAFDFTAYADPTNSQMMVLLTKAGYDYITIEVYDLLGKILLSASPDRNNTTIQFDISNLADEIYVVKVITSKGTKTKKILRQ